jgi:hypothetical protein
MTSTKRSLTLRVDTKDVQRADHLAQILSARAVLSSLKLTRSDVLREALKIGLRHLEDRTDNK